MSKVSPEQADFITVFTFQIWWRFEAVIAKKQIAYFFVDTVHIQLLNHLSSPLLFQTYIGPKFWLLTII